MATQFVTNESIAGVLEAKVQQICMANAPVVNKWLLVVVSQFVNSII